MRPRRCRRSVRGRPAAESRCYCAMLGPRTHWRATSAQEAFSEGTMGSATDLPSANALGVVSAARERAQRIKAIVAASSGNLVEWYDFYTYAFTSIYFAAAFFPAGDATSQLLATAGIFAVGFFMRPLGGWLVGWVRAR